MPPCGERVGHGFAVWVGWGVVVGAAGGVKALFGGVADEYEHGRMAVLAEGLRGEYFQQGVAIERVEGGVALWGWWGAGYADKDALGFAVGAGEIEGVEGVAGVGRDENDGVGAAGDVGGWGFGGCGLGVGGLGGGIGGGHCFSLLMVV